MDSRVSDLIDDLQSGRISHPDGSLDSDALNDRIKALHPRLADEESRVELIRLHDALMSTSERRLIELGRDPEPLREEWRRTYVSFLLAEALVEGEVDEARLEWVRAREVAAGRLHPDETLHVRRLDPAPGEAAAADAPEPAGEGPSELERAYRALFLWEEEKMRPRLDALVEDLHARLSELGPGEDRAAAAGREATEIARWFEENEKGFAAEAVSCLGDDVLKGLKALGVESQFGSVIWEAVDEARADLERRLGEARALYLG